MYERTWDGLADGDGSCILFMPTLDASICVASVDQDGFAVRFQESNRRIYKGGPLL